MEYSAEKQIHNTKGRERHRTHPSRETKEKLSEQFHVKEWKMMSGMLGNGSGVEERNSLQMYGEGIRSHYSEAQKSTTQRVGREKRIAILLRILQSLIPMSIYFRTRTDK